jgi:uncharacterized membrane protein
MNDAILKFLIFVLWPVICLLLITSIAVVLLVAWPLIPFARVVRNGYKSTLKFPW